MHRLHVILMLQVTWCCDFKWHWCLSQCLHQLNIDPTVQYQRPSRFDIATGLFSLSFLVFKPPLLKLHSHVVTWHPAYRVQCSQSPSWRKPLIFPSVSISEKKKEKEKKKKRREKKRKKRRKKGREKKKEREREREKKRKKVGGGGGGEDVAVDMTRHISRYYAFSRYWTYDTELSICLLLAVVAE